MDSNSSSIFGTISPPRIPDQRRGRLRVEQVDTLAKLGGVIACVGVLAALSVVASFWHNGSRAYLMTFLVIFVAIYAAGFRRSIRWRKQVKPLELSRRAYVVRCLHVGFIGLLWSTMPAMLMPVATGNQRLLIVYVSSGLIASAVAIAPTMLAALLIAAPVTTATLISLVTTSDNDGILLGSVVLVYSSLVLVTAAHSYRSFVLRAVSNMELHEQKEVVGLLLREFEQNSSDWLWQTDGEGRLHDTSARMAQVAGVPAAELDGRPFLEWLEAITGSGERAGFEALVRDVHRQAPFRDLVTPVQTHDRTAWWSLTGKPVFDGLGMFNGYRGVASDVTSNMEAQAQVAHLASHDVLTDLPNRALFQNAIKAAMAEPGSRFALLWLDLDRFKAVNDTLGHAVGDALLVEVGKRLRACIGAQDAVARLGGDEFAILQIGGDANAAAALARRVGERVGEPFHLENGVRASVGVTAGIILAPEDGDNPEELLKNADLALYRAKHDGRGGWRFYDPEMDAVAKERSLLQSGLRDAIEREEFQLAFQPIVDPSNGRVVTFEALLRWTHPQRGSVSPAVFIPVAEETGMIVPIGEWVLRSACQEAMRWPVPAQVAVNLSPVQFRDPRLLDLVRSALAESGLPPARLELELTETIFLDASDATLACLHQLRETGVSIALDDFGTGYSSLSYLRSFPFDKVKIDQSFVSSLPGDESCLAIVRAILGMANSLGMRAVAEGVEHAGQAALLRAQGCSRMQGYFFSKPLPASEVERYLQEQATDMLLPGEPVAKLEQLR